jgi:hypothetical protein
MSILAKTEEIFHPVSSSGWAFIASYLGLTLLSALSWNFVPGMIFVLIPFALLCVFRLRYLGRSPWMALFQLIPIVAWGVAIWMAIAEKEEYHG